MVEKVERYVARDGREFIHQESALRHEAIEAMIAEIPELALVRGKLEASLNRISISMEPLARFLRKTTPEAQPETTLEPCCVNTPRGQNHHTDCDKHPDYQANGVVDLADRLAGRA